MSWRGNLPSIPGWKEELSCRADLTSIKKRMEKGIELVGDLPSTKTWMEAGIELEGWQV